MMFEFDVVVEVNRPVEEVFAFLEKAENVPLYNAVVKEARRTSEGPIGIGDISVARNQLLGRSFELTWEFVDYKPSELLAMKSISGPVSAQIAIRFETTPTHATRVTHHYTGETRGFFKLADPLATRIAKRQIRSAMQKMKEILETGAAAET